MLQLSLPNTTATEALGHGLAHACQGQGIVHLVGDLGTGKTTLARGFLHALGHQGAVKSPTYTLVEPYDLLTTRVYHFDLYRLGDPEELEFLGIRDYLAEQPVICLIEWPEQGGELVPPADIEVHLQYADTARQCVVQAMTAYGSQVMQRMQNR